jgi:hypothetical protein
VILEVLVHPTQSLPHPHRDGDDPHLISEARLDLVELGLERLAFPAPGGPEFENGWAPGDEVTLQLNGTPLEILNGGIGPSAPQGESHILRPERAGECHEEGSTRNEESLKASESQAKEKSMHL